MGVRMKGGVGLVSSVELHSLYRTCSAEIPVVLRSSSS